MAKRFRKFIKPAVAYAEARADPAPGPVPVPVPVPDLITAPITEPAAELLPPPMPEPPPPPPPLPAVDLATLPDPDDLSFDDPDAPAAPPGLVPPGNSRSLRRGDEFALVYLHGSSLVERAGPVGRAGRWRVVAYPSRAAAAHAYAHECSRLHDDGFVDYGSPS
jgi:hypothetical protein